MAKYTSLTLDMRTSERLEAAVAAGHTRPEIIRRGLDAIGASGELEAMIRRVVREVLLEVLGGSAQITAGIQPGDDAEQGQIPVYGEPG